MKNKFTIVGLITLILFGICLFALLPLLHAGFFTMHDDEQIGRLSQMYLVISQGQIPPRWIPDLGFGFGYPLFNFYPPFVYYLGSLLHFFGLSLIDSTKIVMGLGFFLASVAMFVWVRKHYGVVSGFFAAVLYTYAPYHSVDIYVRGALAEFFSWIWVPAIFLSVDLLFEKLQKRYIVLLGVFFALLMLSHTLVMLQFAPIFGIYLLFAFFTNKNDIWKKLLFLGLGILLGLGLSAYFWIPSLAEKQYTLVDTILTKELANYAMHFVCPLQLWSGVWGYGGSTGGCVDGLSFQIGKIQILAALLGILLSIFYALRKRIFLPIAIVLIFLFSILLTLDYSQFIWDTIKPFWYIQFPWRYLLFVAVGSAFLGGFFLSFIQKRFGLYTAILFGCILSFLAIYQVRNDFKPQTYKLVTDKDMTTVQALRWYVSSLSYEYVPKDVATKKTDKGTTQLAITPLDIPRSVAVVASGKMHIHTVEDISHLKKAQINVYNQGIVTLNTYVFPGWKVFVNGKEVTQFIQNKFGLMQFALPVGDYVVTMQFTETPIRRVADGISIITLVGLIMLFIWIRYKKI